MRLSHILRQSVQSFKHVNNQPPRRKLVAHFLHQHPADYLTTYLWQKQLVQAMIEHDRRIEALQANNQSNDPSINQQIKQLMEQSFDSLLIVQHEPVYTVGRGGQLKHVCPINQPNNSSNHQSDHTVAAEDMKPIQLTDLKQANQWRDQLVDHSDNQLVKQPINQSTTSLLTSSNSILGVPLYRVDRGGSVTHHGRGQLTAYPIINLNHAPHRRDLHAHLRSIEQSIIQSIHRFGITQGVWQDSENTGVWIDKRKICAIGLSCSRWITSHGAALNVDIDMSYFDAITPCGIEDQERSVTDLSSEIQRKQSTEPSTDQSTKPTLDAVASVLSEQFASIWDLELVTTKQSVDQTIESIKQSIKDSNIDQPVS